MSTPQPHADSRDMIVVHDVFRRQFAAIPGLVTDVPTGDSALTVRVADHVVWMCTVLHTHHEGEDELVWPKLLQRAPAETNPLIHVMEEQHHALDLGLRTLEATTVAWRETGGESERDALVEAATGLLPVMTEHLELEEREVLSLIDTYLTDQEWKELGPHGLKKSTLEKSTVFFGIILTTASADQVKIMQDNIPPEAWAVLSVAGPEAYRRYIETLHPQRVSAETS